MTNEVILKFFGALTGGHRPVATGVGLTDPLPVAGGQGDNVALTTGGANGVMVGGIINTTVGGPALGTGLRFGALLLDGARKLLIKPLGHNASHIFNRVSTNGVTPVSLIVAVASQKADLQSITIANRDTVAHTVDIQDVTTTVLTVILAAGTTEHLPFPAGLPNAIVNTAWNVVLRAAHTTNPVEVSASGYRTTA